MNCFAVLTSGGLFLSPVFFWFVHVRGCTAGMLLFVYLAIVRECQTASERALNCLNQDIYVYIYIFYI